MTFLLVKNSVTNSMEQNSWNIFLPKFKSAVAKRDDVALSRMMTKKVYCYDKDSGESL